MIIKVFIKKYLLNQLKKKFDELKKLTYEIDHDDLIYYFKNNFDNDIELFRKIQSGEMMLGNTKEPQNIFKLNLNGI